MSKTILQQFKLRVPKVEFDLIDGRMNLQRVGGEVQHASDVEVADPNIPNLAFSNHFFQNLPRRIRIFRKCLVKDFCVFLDRNWPMNQLQVQTINTKFRK